MGLQTPTFNPDDTIQLYYTSIGLHHYSNRQNGESAHSDDTENNNIGSFNAN